MILVDLMAHFRPCPLCFPGCRGHVVWEDDFPEPGVWRFIPLEEL